MAAAKANSARIAATHARAEADEASFFEREKIAAEKGQQESQNSQAMNDEREINRQRKLDSLKDLGSDSWHNQKQGGDDSNWGGSGGGGRSRFRRKKRGDGGWGGDNYSSGYGGGDRWTNGDDPSKGQDHSWGHSGGDGWGQRDNIKSWADDVDDEDDSRGNSGGW